MKHSRIISIWEILRRYWAGEISCFLEQDVDIDDDWKVQNVLVVDSRGRNYCPARSGKCTIIIAEQECPIGHTFVVKE